MPPAAGSAAAPGVFAPLASSSPPPCSSSPPAAHPAVLVAPAHSPAAGEEQLDSFVGVYVHTTVSVFCQNLYHSRIPLITSQMSLEMMLFSSLFYADSLKCAAKIIGQSRCRKCYRASVSCRVFCCLI